MPCPRSAGGSAPASPRAVPSPPPRPAEYRFADAPEAGMNRQIQSYGSDYQIPAETAPLHPAVHPDSDAATRTLRGARVPEQHARIRRDSVASHLGPSRYGPRSEELLTKP